MSQNSIDLLWIYLNIRSYQPVLKNYKIVSQHNKTYSSYIFLKLPNHYNQILITYIRVGTRLYLYYLQ